MEKQLKERLWKFIIEHNPELMFSLQENYSVTPYLTEKIKSIEPQLKTWKQIGYPEPSILLLAMEVLTSELKPSRFQFVLSLLKQEFPMYYKQYSEKGLLTYKTITLVELCKGAFDSVRFSEAHFNSKRFKVAISGIIKKYILLNTYPLRLLKKQQTAQHVQNS